MDPLPVTLSTSNYHPPGITSTIACIFPVDEEVPLLCCVSTDWKVILWLCFDIRPLAVVTQFGVDKPVLVVRSFGVEFQFHLRLSSFIKINSSLVMKHMVMKNLAGTVISMWSVRSLARVSHILNIVSLCGAPVANYWKIGCKDFSHVLPRLSQVPVRNGPLENL